MCDITFGYV